MSTDYRFLPNLDRKPMVSNWRWHPELSLKKFTMITAEEIGNIGRSQWIRFVIGIVCLLAVFVREKLNPGLIFYFLWLPADN